MSYPTQRTLDLFDLMIDGTGAIVPRPKAPPAASGIGRTEEKPAYTVTDHRATQRSPGGYGY